MPREIGTVLVEDRAAAGTASVYRSILSRLGTTGADRFGTVLVVLNFVMLFLRPQNDISIIGTIRLPLILSIFGALVWLTRVGRTWTTQTRLLMLFLIVETVRTLLGKLVFDGLVRNDRWSFNTLADLYIQFTGLIFPLVVFCNNIRGVRTLVRTWLFVSIYLAVYVIMHGGFGPGGFLGDENDAGLVLLMFLPLPLAYLTEGGVSAGRKLLLFVSAVLVLAAITITLSRGAFVGMVIVITYFFYRSRNKFKLLIAASLLFVCVLPFVPEQYAEEIRSIQDTASGTAQTRRHFWKIATRVWLDPRHFIQGVGLANTPYHFGDYERPEDVVDGPSIAGRAVHSIYFQLLPDLGLWGIFIVGGIVLSSFRSNKRLGRQVDRLMHVSRLRLREQDGSKGEDTERDHALVATVLRELQFLRPLFLATNLAFVAVLGAGMFVSALYYPPLWLLAGISALLSLYWERLRDPLEEQLESTKRAAEASA